LKFILKIFSGARDPFFYSRYHTLVVFPDKPKHKDFLFGISSFQSQIPTTMNNLFFKIIAKMKIAEHFKSAMS